MPGPRDRPGTARLAGVSPLWLGKALPCLQWPCGDPTSWIWRKPLSLVFPDSEAFLSHRKADSWVLSVPMPGCAAGWPLPASDPFLASRPPPGHPPFACTPLTLPLLFVGGGQCVCIIL